MSTRCRPDVDQISTRSRSDLDQISTESVQNILTISTRSRPNLDQISTIPDLYHYQISTRSQLDLERISTKSSELLHVQISTKSQRDLDQKLSANPTIHSYCLISAWRALMPSHVIVKPETRAATNRSEKARQRARELSVITVQWSNAMHDRVFSTDVSRNTSVIKCEGKFTWQPGYPTRNNTSIIKCLGREALRARCVCFFWRFRANHK